MKGTSSPSSTRCSLALGIDLGRTWLRACLADGQGRILGRCRIPAVPWPRLPEVLPLLRRRLKFRRLSRLSLGSPALWKPSSLAAARRLLRPWAAQVTAYSDVELAHAAAFGGGPGVLIAAGTGSIAFARDTRGRRRRAGGWGQLLGDEGSGFWIGRAALRDAVLRRLLRLGTPALAPTPENVRAVARLAPRVLRLARREPRARRVRDEAVRHLADLTLEAGRGLAWGRKIPVSCWGGVFRDRALRAGWRLALRRVDKRLTVCEPRFTAQEAAAMLDIDRASPRG